MSGAPGKISSKASVIACSSSTAARFWSRWRTSISPKQLLQSFKTAQPDFYDALEKIPEHKAWWNPIRELGDAADN